MSTTLLRQLALELLASDTPDPSARWCELLAGGWELLDAFEHDGRRYFVAEQAPSGRCDRLSTEEHDLLARRAAGASVKSLAAKAGVSEATLSRRVQRAMKKLGVASQAELARMLVLNAAAAQSST